MQVRFYFDPLCPWCWITAHWLHDEVAPHRDLQIDWRSISLLVRNEGKDMDPEYAERFLPAMHRSFGLLRIVEALRADGHADLVHDVYLAFGRHFHHGEDGMDFDIAEALTAAGADPSYASAYDDTAYDTAVRASTTEAEEVAGDDVGTPIIAFEVDALSGGTEWRGYFGPVIPSVVTGEQALRLWDGLALMVQTEGFYELKRTRTAGPDLNSIKLG